MWKFSIKWRNEYFWIDFSKSVEYYEIGQTLGSLGSEKGPWHGSQRNLSTTTPTDQSRKKENVRGFKIMAGLVGGPGIEPPGRRRIFENLQKNFLRENSKIMKKCIILASFPRNSKPSVKFSLVWTINTICWGNFEKVLMKFYYKNWIFIFPFLWRCIMLPLAVPVDHRRTDITEDLNAKE